MGVESILASFERQADVCITVCITGGSQNALIRGQRRASRAWHETSAIPTWSASSRGLFRPRTEADGEDSSRRAT